MGNDGEQQMTSDVDEDGFTKDEPSRPDDLIEVRIWNKDGSTFGTSVIWKNGLSNKEILVAMLAAKRAIDFTLGKMK